eukprot:g5411.t1
MGKLLIFLAKKRQGDEEFLRKEEEREKTDVVINAVLDTVVDELTDAFVEIVHVERSRRMDWEDEQREEKRKTAIRKFARRRRRQRRRAKRRQRKRSQRRRDRASANRTSCDDVNDDDDDDDDDDDETDSSVSSDESDTTDEDEDCRWRFAETISAKTAAPDKASLVPRPMTATVNALENLRKEKERKRKEWHRQSKEKIDALVKLRQRREEETVERRVREEALQRARQMAARNQRKRDFALKSARIATYKKTQKAKQRAMKKLKARKDAEETKQSLEDVRRKQMVRDSKLRRHRKRLAQAKLREQIRKKAEAVQTERKRDEERRAREAQRVRLSEIRKRKTKEEREKKAQKELEQKLRRDEIRRVHERRMKRQANRSKIKKERERQSREEERRLVHERMEQSRKRAEEGRKAALARVKIRQATEKKQIQEIYEDMYDDDDDAKRWSDVTKVRESLPSLSPGARRCGSNERTPSSTSEICNRFVGTRASHETRLESPFKSPSGASVIGTEPPATKKLVSGKSKNRRKKKEKQKRRGVEDQRKYHVDKVSGAASDIFRGEMLQDPAIRARAVLRVIEARRLHESQASNTVRSFASLRSVSRSTAGTTNLSSVSGDRRVIDRLKTESVALKTLENDISRRTRKIDKLLTKVVSTSSPSREVPESDLSSSSSDDDVLIVKNLLLSRAKPTDASKMSKPVKPSSAARAASKGAAKEEDECTRSRLRSSFMYDLARAWRKFSDASLSANLASASANSTSSNSHRVGYALPANVRNLMRAVMSCVSPALDLDFFCELVARAKDVDAPNSYVFQATIALIEEAGEHVRWTTSSLTSDDRGSKLFHDIFSSESYSKSADSHRISHALLKRCLSVQVSASSLTASTMRHGGARKRSDPSNARNLRVRALKSPLGQRQSPRAKTSTVSSKSTAIFSKTRRRVAGDKENAAPAKGVEVAFTTKIESGGL